MRPPTSFAFFDSVAICAIWNNANGVHQSILADGVGERIEFRQSFACPSFDGLRTTFIALGAGAQLSENIKR
ncbi:MAG: hypothetical protein AB1817_20315 [Chloroflexota bacterium]